MPLSDHHLAPTLAVLPNSLLVGVQCKLTRDTLTCGAEASIWRRSYTEIYAMRYGEAEVMMGSSRR